MSKLLDETAEYYYDTYGCSGDWLVVLFGLSEVLRMSVNCGLDRKYKDEYMEMKNKLENEEEENES